MPPDPSTGWIAAVRGIRLDEVALAAGFELTKRGFLDRCPVCGETRRSAHDQRIGAAKVNIAGGLWYCYRCCVGGGGVELLIGVLFATPKLPAGDPRWPQVRAWFAARGWCSPSRDAAPCPRVPPPPPRAAPPQHSWPPMDEVASLWRACLPLAVVGGRHSARRYLERHRQVNLDALDAFGLVRVLPAAYAWPRWVPVGVDPELWCGLYPLVVPLYDAVGDLRSLRFRVVDRVYVPDPGGEHRLVPVMRKVDSNKKALNARGHACAGLVLAEPMAAAVLAGRDEDDGVGWDGRIVVTEGEPDFWTWSTRDERWPSVRAERLTYAVIGIGSGGWSDQVAARIPDGATVIIRTHHDRAGDAYAERVAASLAGRAAVHRAPKPTEDGR